MKSRGSLDSRFKMPFMVLPAPHPFVDCKEHAIGKMRQGREPGKEIYLVGNLTLIQGPNLFGTRSFRLAVQGRE